MQFTRIPRRGESGARAAVNRTTAALLAAYTGAGWGPMPIPAIDEILTMTPPPDARMAAMASCVPSTTPRRFVSSTRSQPSGSSSGNTTRGDAPASTTPALFTRMSSRPKRVWTSSNILRIAPSFATSAAIGTERPLPSSMRRTVSSAIAPSISLTTTVAPPRASCRAVARPIPEPAPVTSATCPSIFIALLSWPRRRAPSQPTRTVSRRVVSLTSMPCLRPLALRAGDPAVGGQRQQPTIDSLDGPPFHPRLTGPLQVVASRRRRRLEPARVNAVVGRRVARTLERLRRPAPGTEQEPMILPRHVELVQTLCRPVEAGLDVDHRGRKEDLVDLDRTQKMIVRKRVEQDVHDLGDRRRGAPQVEAGRLVERITPRRGDERNDQIVAGRGHGAKARQEVSIANVDRRLDDPKIALRDREHARIGLEPDASRTRDVTQQPVQRIARAGERIDDQRTGDSR